MDPLRYNISDFRLRSPLKEKRVIDSFDCTSVGSVSFTFTDKISRQTSNPIETPNRKYLNFQKIEVTVYVLLNC